MVRQWFFSLRISLNVPNEYESQLQWQKVRAQLQAPTWLEERVGDGPY